MEWIAIPFAAATVAATARRRGARPASRPLAADADRAHRRRRRRGRALRRAPRRRSRTVDDPREVGALAGAGFIAFFLAERVLVLHHRDDPEQARAHHQVGALGALGLSVAQLHRRPRDRPRLRARHGDRRARLHRRDQPRLRRRPEHGQLRAQPVRRPAPGEALARDRRLRAAGRRDRRQRDHRLARRRWAGSSPSTRASSSTWAPPTCSPEAVGTASTRRGRPGHALTIAGFAAISRSRGSRHVKGRQSHALARSPARAGRGRAR